MKTVIIFVVLILAAWGGYSIYSKETLETVPVGTSGIKSETGRTDSPAPIMKRGADNIEYSIFGCDGGKQFKAEFIAGNQAKITVGENPSIILTQTVESPHLYQSEAGANSFYVEGDEGSLNLRGDLYNNCVAALI